MSEPCPLIFEPIFKPKVWGGRNLERQLGKKLPDGALYGESWECADLPNGQSVVARGPVSGRTLHSLIEEWGTALLGRTEAVDGSFPFLIKFLDACQDLSVQVHPDPETALRLGGNVRVKHEAWYIIAAEQDACIYRGVRPGTSVADLRAAMSQRPDAILDYLLRIPVKPGQMYFLPSGTLHALGAGVLVAEIQTPSDITYRLYDWGRVRPASDAGMHVEQGLDCVRTDIDFSQYEKRSHVSSPFTTVTRLVTCPSFIIEKVRFVGEMEQELPYAELVCWVVLEGSGEIHYGRGRSERFSRGHVVILPADLKEGKLRTNEDCAWLEVTAPVKSDLADFPRPTSEQLQDTPPNRQAPLQIKIDAPRRPSAS